MEVYTNAQVALLAAVTSYGEAGLSHRSEPLFRADEYLKWLDSHTDS